jgi:hypothetical protein
MKEEERVRKELRETEMLRNRKGVAQAKAAEERGDKTGKFHLDSGPLDFYDISDVLICVAV